jgi:hypothetical protein
MSILSFLEYSLSFALIKTNYTLNQFVTDLETGCEGDCYIAIISDSLNAKDIWNNYIKAIGGADNLLKVRDSTVILESNIGGQKIVLMTYQKMPDKMRQIITCSSITQDIYFDGGNGVIKIGGKKINMAGGELEKLKYESMINLIINIDSLGVKLTSDGIEEVNNKDCYKIELHLPSGTIITQYFDLKTWLKVKQIEKVSVTQKYFVQETYFNYYREVMCVKYPFSIKESLGSQSMDLTVTSVKVNTDIDDGLFVIK